MSQLTYQDALDLKEAGFPQDWSEFDDHDQELLRGEESWKMYGKGYCPTLEELIEACGSDFYSLVHTALGEGTWKCFSEVFDDNSVSTGVGESPIQAVKNLWIQLHGK